MVPLGEGIEGEEAQAFPGKDLLDECMSSHVT